VELGWQSTKFSSPNSLISTAESTKADYKRHKANFDKASAELCKMEGMVVKPAANCHSQTIAMAKTPQQLLFAKAVPMSTNMVMQMDVDSSSKDNIVLLKVTATNVVRPHFPADHSDDKEQA
jgi:hypothetical protein